MAIWRHLLPAPAAPPPVEADLGTQEPTSSAVALRFMLHELRRTPDAESATAALLGAAELLEHAAYALARTPEPRLVTYLFLIAAELERKAERIDCNA